jgi:hypothetical protein
MKGVLIFALVSIALALQCLVVEATYGFDISSPISVETAKCLKGQGFDFAVVRVCCHDLGRIVLVKLMFIVFVFCFFSLQGYESIGRIDDSVYGSVSNLWSAGMAHVDVYFFPCHSCGARFLLNHVYVCVIVVVCLGNARGQVQAAVSGWRSRGLKYGMMWCAHVCNYFRWFPVLVIHSMVIGSTSRLRRPGGRAIATCSSCTIWLRRRSHLVCMSASTPRRPCGAR